MATKYAKEIASTLADIRQAGAAAQWFNAQAGVDDPSSPFPSPSPAHIPHDVFVVLAPIGSNPQAVKNMVDGGEVPAGAELALMGNHGFRPTLRDWLTVGDEKRYVKAIDVLQPDGTPILYTLLLAQ